MMKKDFTSLPFVLGIVLIVMVAVTAAVIADAVPCNGFKRSNPQSASVVCHAALMTVYCTQASSSPYTCYGIQEIVPAFSGAGTPLFLSSEPGPFASDHAVIFQFKCGTVHNCEWDSEKGKCVVGSVARDPSGDPIERTCSYYDNGSCTIGGAG